MGSLPLPAEVWCIIRAMATKKMNTQVLLSTIATPVGPMYLGVLRQQDQPDRLCMLSFKPLHENNHHIIRLFRITPQGTDISHITPSACADQTKGQLDEYFQGLRKKFTIPLALLGTSFQNRVWNELLKIPFGQTRSYQQIAEAAGSPKGFRAVGGANNANNIAIMVPCHRVINATGKLGGYAGGLKTKCKLLDLESPQQPVLAMISPATI